MRARAAVEHDHPSGDAIGHAHAAVGHQPAGDRPAVLGVGVGAGRTTRVAGRTKAGRCRLLQAHAGNGSTLRPETPGRRLQRLWPRLLAGR